MKLLTSKFIHPRQLEIEELIQKYNKVFKYLPTDLPLESKIEHIIEVNTGSSPMNVNPYMYPHHHKT